MKLKKYSYLVVFILMLLIGMNGVHAAAKYTKTCYYLNDEDDMRGVLTLKSGFQNPRNHGIKAYAGFSLEKTGYLVQHRSEKINNWFGGMGGMFEANSTTTGIEFENIYDNSVEANKDSDPSCPKYVVVQHCTAYRVWGTDSKELAEQAVNGINGTSDCQGYYASYGKEINGVFEPYTAEEYYGTFGELNGGGEEAPLTCPGLFGDETDDGDQNDVGDDGVASLSYLINKVLGYVRIIVPILIIVLGTIDLASAVVSGKEDGMRKAQITFVKRLIAGVCVFLSPVLINIIMQLADIVWEGLGYSSCNM